MILRLIDLFAGWKLKLAALGVALAALGAVFLKVYLAGKDAARSAADKANLKAMRKRKEINDEIASLDQADLDERYTRWLRDKR